MVLAVTGAEALYADMGHFGRRPISRAWLLLALPALVLCYAGQSALVLADPSAIDQSFYKMAPASLLSSLLEGQRTGAITRQLASWAAVLAVPTAIAGIYGMNFENMPELGTRYGYFVVSATTCALFYLRFKRVGLPAHGHEQSEFPGKDDR